MILDTHYLPCSNCITVEYNLKIFSARLPMTRQELGSTIKEVGQETLGLQCLKLFKMAEMNLIEVSKLPPVLARKIIPVLGIGTGFLLPTVAKEATNITNEFGAGVDEIINRLIMPGVIDITTTLTSATAGIYLYSRTGNIPLSFASFLAAKIILNAGESIVSRL